MYQGISIYHCYKSFRSHLEVIQTFRRGLSNLSRDVYFRGKKASEVLMVCQYQQTTLIEQDKNIYVGEYCTFTYQF